MTDSSTLTGIAAIIAASGAVVATVLGYLNRRSMGVQREKAAEAAAAAEAARVAAEDSKREIIATKDGVFELGRAVDGRFTELLRVTKAAALAEGRLEGTATEKARAAEERG